MPAPRLQGLPTRPQPCLPGPSSGLGTHHLTDIRSQGLAYRFPWWVCLPGTPLGVSGPAPTTQPPFLGPRVGLQPTYLACLPSSWALSTLPRL